MTRWRNHMYVGLFMHLEDHQVWWPVVNGVGQVAHDNGSHLVVYATTTLPQSASMDEAQARSTFCFREDSLNGSIMAFISKGMLEYAQRLRAKHHPVVLVARQAEGVPHVLCDNRNAIRRAVESLHSRGHRRIVFLNGEPGNYSADERRAGYQEGLAKCGIEYDPDLVIHGGFLESVGRIQVEAALKRSVHFTALIAANDPSAFGALAALRDRGLRVPEDVEVVGFDNMARGRWTEPPLSTIDMQFYPMAHLAAEELFRLIRSGSCRDQVLVQTNFIPRKSTRQNGEGARTSLLGADWMEHRLYYEIGLSRLRRDPQLAQLMDGISSATIAPEALEEAFQKLIEAAAGNQVEVSCLFRLLEDAQAHVANGSADGLQVSAFDVHFNRAVSLVAAAACDEQRKRAETAIRFRSASGELRDLSFETPSETAVIARLRQTIRNLDIARAGLFLPSTDDSEQSENGTWHWWYHKADGSFHTEEKSMLKSEIEIRDYIKDTPPSTWLVLPLIHNGAQFGFLLLQAETEFLLYYGELVRQVSAALHGARMYTALSNAHEALRKSQRELIEASRLAGIAEIATGILHNIGNAMNSVTTSASLALDQLKKSRISGVTKISELLHENKDKLPEFFASDPRGPQVVDYLKTLSSLLERERGEMLKEVDSLRSGIEHINNIVAAQQSYVGAAVSGLTEVVAPAELMENAWRLNEASLTRHNIAVVHEFGSVPQIRVQRQKALQILVNLIRNAKDSLDQSGRDGKQVVLRTRCASDDGVQLEVSDNGLGIDEEGLTRIFGFGFTTKKNGHGFGLHSSALAANEMGGSLRVESAGVGKGATFILTIPSAAKSDSN